MDAFARRDMFRAPIKNQIAMFFEKNHPKIKAAGVKKFFLVLSKKVDLFPKCDLKCQENIIILCDTYRRSTGGSWLVLVVSSRHAAEPEIEFVVFFVCHFLYLLPLPLSIS